MTTLSQSPANDLSIDANGILKISTGIDAYADIISAAIRTTRGELQLNEGAGVPYFDTVFKNYGGIEQWKNAVRNIVNGFDFVRTIQSFDAKVSGNVIAYEMTISTDLGNVSVSS